MNSRRTFLSTGLRTSGLLALAPTVPGFLVRTARAAPPARDGRVLVVVQLEGGNDGVNTVVPYSDEGYAKHRTSLRLPTNRLLKLDRAVGLHPALGGAAKLLEDGRLAVVHGVGYPAPSRSHFEAMAVWQTGRVIPPGRGRLEEREKADGWLGRALAVRPHRPGQGAEAVFVGPEEVPVALRGRGVVAASLADPRDAVLALAGGAGDPAAAGELAAFVARHTLDAYLTSAEMAKSLRDQGRGRGYPPTALGERLELVSRLLKGGAAARVYYAAHGWYDTHAAQMPEHERLLAELGGGLKAFLDDLAASGLADRVAVLVFSEFGRRVAENGSGGTDHGTAGPVFVAGPGVRAGLVGSVPTLTDLADGDLKVGIDFRRVYATVLEDWLGLPAGRALGGAFERLPLFRS